MILEVVNDMFLMCIFYLMIVFVEAFAMYEDETNKFDQLYD